MHRHIPFPALLLLPALAMGAPETDTRQIIDVPGPIREQILVNMRDHLLAIQQIAAELAQDHFDAAADLAEERLGMTAMQRHGGHEIARYMPDGMRATATAMHHAGSRLAIVARDAAVTTDPAGSIAALSNVMAQCVACHSGYRMQ